VSKKTIRSLSSSDLQGKRVLVRADFNVPVDEQGRITDDTRIRAALPTIQNLIGKGAKVILCSHFGRPKHGVEAKYRLTPIGQRLAELLGQPVVKTDDCIGDAVAATVNAMQPGDVVLLENVRFHQEEAENDAGFAQKLAAIADLYVNDAFGTAHRAHASTVGVTKFLQPCVAGLLMEKELHYLQSAIANPQRPFAAIIGGAKVSSKIGIIKALLDQVDQLLIGGGMMFTFYKARGLSVGKSLVEADKLELARAIAAKAQAKGVELLLPTDVVVADDFSPNANTQIVSVENIPEGWIGLDIGPDSVKTFQHALGQCQSVIWNGPMGVFEMAKFAQGTEAIAHTLAELTLKGTTTIIGGGDSAAAVKKFGLASQMSFISTGGGATLELLEGKELPAIAALDEA
jgi:phosphoglycerate kinase